MPGHFRFHLELTCSLLRGLLGILSASLFVFHGVWSNSCNMEEVEEVIEPIKERIIDCVAFFYEEGKGGKLPA